MNLVKKKINSLLSERTIIISGSEKVRYIRVNKLHYAILLIIITLLFIYISIITIDVKKRESGISNVETDKANLEIINKKLTNEINALSVEIGEVNNYLSVVGKDVGKRKETIERKAKELNQKNPIAIKIAYQSDNNLDIIKANMSEALDKINNRQNYLIRLAKYVAPGSQITKSDAPHLDTYFDGNFELHKVSFSQQLKNAIKIEKAVTYLPVASPLYNYKITSNIGKRLNPVTHKVTIHKGIDLAAPHGSPVYTSGSGTVKFAGSQTGYGNVIEVSHGNSLSTKYAHLQKILVKRGDKVTIGDKIGLEGNTGCSSGPHLHYEVLVAGKFQNPHHFISAANNVKHQTAQK